MFMSFRSGGGLVHVIMNEHGPEECKRFLNQCQSIVNYWLLNHGFTVGIGDTVADASTMATINKSIAHAKTEVQRYILMAQRGDIEQTPGKTIMEVFESMVNRALNDARDKAGSSAQRSLSVENNIKMMVTAGSKGSFINISQVLQACC